MTGNEFLKQSRVNKGYSVRQFGKMADITPRMVTYYESGEKLVIHLPVYKCLTMFRLLDISVEKFFCEYYFLNKEVDAAVKQWNKEHPKELDFATLKKRIYYRLAQIKKRESISGKNLEYIYDLYDIFFLQNHNNYRAGQDISLSDYQNYIIPIFYQIKISMNALPDERISRIILDTLYHTDYTVSDLCFFCGITIQRLNDYLNNKRDFSGIHVDTAIKICYVLNLNFDEIFGSCGKYN